MQVQGKNYYAIQDFNIGFTARVSKTCEVCVQTGFRAIQFFSTTPQARQYGGVEAFFPTLFLIVWAIYKMAQPCPQAIFAP
ncbi:hypothetical protein [Cnuella takakiae]|uniref:hypothetical protein n=1 Tax=Cnuella takakiae TaxID=1302690 RepID=UPI0009339DCC|nr:hypothetical protein [Cnuella takakiae]OLY92438.1 hypothetical protein BUE76_11480 [Cnuella takakiae]